MIQNETRIQIRSGFNDGDVVIVLNRNEPQTVVVPIDESGIQDQVVQSLQQLFSRIDEPETDSAPISNALSESIQTEQTTHLNPSLLFV